MMTRYNTRFIIISWPATVITDRITYLISYLVGSSP
ncbi:hypothetical protein CI610_01574 [invertebrate metagenome]|uniref:Uncharacterized protein n=1 Tax=invertebrate metagenome TaxID=1711999 RepID=A0A2H9T8A3_9ZZZZ